jgi:hypothetical protein
LNPQKKEKKTTYIIRDEIFQKSSGVHPLFYHKRIEEVLEQLKIEPVNEKLGRYKSKWLRQVTRMNNMIPKIMLNYRSNSGRRLGRSLKRPLDDAETDLFKPNS